MKTIFYYTLTLALVFLVDAASLAEDRAPDISEQPCIKLVGEKHEPRLL